MSKKRVYLELIVYLCELLLTLGIGIPFFLSAKFIFKIIILVLTIAISILWLFFITKNMLRLSTLYFGKIIKCKVLEIHKESSMFMPDHGQSPQYLFVKYENNSLKHCTDSISFNNLTKLIKVGDLIPVRCLKNLQYIDYDCLLNELDLSEKSSNIIK